jgi:integrase
VIGMTVSALLDRWLATVKPNLRATTCTRYTGYTEVHFKPALGSKRLAKLTHDDVQAMVNAKRDETRKHGKKVKKHTARTLHLIYVVLGTALNWGVKKGYLMVSPMLRVDPPRVPKSEITPLTPAQTAALLAAADAAADPLLGLWTIAAVTGARGRAVGCDMGRRGPGRGYAHDPPERHPRREDATVAPHARDA